MKHAHRYKSPNKGKPGARLAPAAKVSAGDQLYEVQLHRSKGWRVRRVAA